VEAEVSQRLSRNRFTEELRAVAVHPQMGVEGSHVADYGVQVVDVLQDPLEMHSASYNVSYVCVLSCSLESSG